MTAEAWSGKWRNLHVADLYTSAVESGVEGLVLGLGCFEDLLSFMASYCAWARGRSLNARDTVVGGYWRTC